MDFRPAESPRLLRPDKLWKQHEAGGGCPSGQFTKVPSPAKMLADSTHESIRFVVAVQLWFVRGAEMQSAALTWRINWTDGIKITYLG
jgi:hypothetical protein